MDISLSGLNVRIGARGSMIDGAAERICFHDDPLIVALLERIRDTHGRARRRAGFGDELDLRLRGVAIHRHVGDIYFHGAEVEGLQRAQVLANGVSDRIGGGLLILLAANGCDAYGQQRENA